MSQAMGINWIQWLMTVVVIAMLVGLLVGAFQPDHPEVPTYPTASQIASQIVIPKVVLPDIDLSKIDQIYREVSEDDNWEDEIELLAADEYSEYDNRDLFRAIEKISDDIEDKEDIIYVREDENSEFSRMDADDRDGIVTQFLKIKYEDDDGHDRKIYLTVITEFDDGDLEDQEIFETD